MEIETEYRWFKRKRRIILTNDKHNTSVVLMVHPDEPLTFKQSKRAREQLCGIEGCPCNEKLGTRGPQGYDILYIPGDGWKITSRQLSIF